MRGRRASLAGKEDIFLFFTTTGTHKHGLKGEVAKRGAANSRDRRDEPGKAAGDGYSGRQRAEPLAARRRKKHIFISARYRLRLIAHRVEISISDLTLKTAIKHLCSGQVVHALV